MQLHFFVDITASLKLACRIHPLTIYLTQHLHIHLRIHIDTTPILHTYILHIYYTHIYHTYITHIYTTHILHTYILHIYTTHILHTYILHIYYTHIYYTYTLYMIQVEEIRQREMDMTKETIQKILNTGIYTYICILIHRNILCVHAYC